MLVSGPTMSGKSTFVHDLIKSSSSDIFETQPKEIYWYYDQYNPDLYGKSYILNKRLPDNFEHIEPHSFIVLDDLMDKAKNHAALTMLLTKLVYHKQLFVMY